MLPIVNIRITKIIAAKLICVKLKPRNLFKEKKK